ncbi:MAG: metalloregulator ArsR/SmtB family transcription factor [Bacteroidia bacterium]|nr:metalloregulator ArsR/SmtB family transcription factor [Bacteroidia bacterium]
MAINKKHSFESRQIELADFAKALAHPARIAIIEVLIKRQSCICGEIVEELPLSQSTVSQHLKELKKVGLITGEIEGVRTCYCLDLTVFDQFIGLFQHLKGEIDTYKEKINCC